MLFCRGFRATGNHAPIGSANFCTKRLSVRSFYALRFCTYYFINNTYKCNDDVTIVNTILKMNSSKPKNFPRRMYVKDFRSSLSF